MVALQAHILDQLPRDLAIEVLWCAPGTFSRQIQRLPHSHSSLVALSVFPALEAACTLLRDCPGAASDLPTLALCVGLDQAGDVDGDAQASAETTSHNASLVCGNHAAQASIWVRFDEDSEPADEDSLFSLRQLPHVVACPVIARSNSLPDLSLQLPDSTCLVLDSRNAALDIRRAKFEGVSFTAL